MEYFKDDDFICIKSNSVATLLKCVWRGE